MNFSEARENVFCWWVHLIKKEPSFLVGKLKGVPPSSFALYQQRDLDPGDLRSLHWCFIYKWKICAELSRQVKEDLVHYILPSNSEGSFDNNFTQLLFAPLIFSPFLFLWQQRCNQKNPREWDRRLPERSPHAVLLVFIPVIWFEKNWKFGVHLITHG